MSTETSTIAVPSMRSKHPKRLDIQGLRAIAVILVVIEHARWGLSGGFTGVDIFFVISGFVITLSLLRDLNDTGRIRFKDFYKRRIFRLMPAATLVTLVSAATAILLVSPLGLQQQAAATGGAALVWISNIALYFISSDYFSPHVQANPFLHTWSLGVEEQFYLVFPVVIALSWLVARKFRQSPVKFLVIVILLIGAASFALSLATSMGSTLGVISNPAQFAFYMMPTRAWEFAAGVLLALALSRRGAMNSASPAVAGGISLLGLVLIGIGAAAITNAMYFPGYAALLPVLGAALVIFGGAKNSVVSAILGTKPLVWVGDRTYSLYLWHWPLIVFARRIWPDSWLAIVFAVILAFVLADITYRYVESPFNAFGRKPIAWQSALGPAGIFVAAGVMCVVLLVGSLTSWNNPQLRASTDQLNERPLGYKECLSTVPVSKRDLSACTWGADRPGPPIYLMGDSNAQQYTEALVGAAEQLDRPLTIATWGGCVFFDVKLHHSTDPTKGLECSTYVADGTEWIINQSPGTVILANSGTAITSEGTTLDGESDTDAKASVWQRSLQEQLLGLADAGHEPFLIATTPHFPDKSRDWWHPADCSNDNLKNSPDACSVSLSMDEVNQQRKSTLAAETAAAKLTGTETFDPVSGICDDGCSTYRDGTWIYRDGLHISPEQSRSMAGLFAVALTE